MATNYRLSNEFVFGIIHFFLICHKCLFQDVFAWVLIILSHFSTWVCCLQRNFAYRQAQFNFTGGRTAGIQWPTPRSWPQQFDNYAREFSALIGMFAD